MLLSVGDKSKREQLISDIKFTFDQTLCLNKTYLIFYFGASKVNDIGYNTEVRNIKHRFLFKLIAIHSSMNLLL